MGPRLFRGKKGGGLKASDSVLRWLLLLKEYGVSFEYLKVKKNVVADALSRLNIDLENAIRLTSILLKAYLSLFF
jgi:hypothetical protein